MCVCVCAGSVGCCVAWRNGSGRAGRMGIFVLQTRVWVRDRSCSLFTSVCRAGLAALCEGLRSCRQLLVLDLSYNALADMGAAALSACLSDMPALASLTLAGNAELGDAGVAALAAAARGCLALRRVGLRGTAATALGMKVRAGMGATLMGAGIGSGHEGAGTGAGEMGLGRSKAWGLRDTAGVEGSGRGLDDEWVAAGTDTHAYVLQLGPGSVTAPCVRAPLPGHRTWRLHSRPTCGVP